MIEYRDIDEYEKGFIDGVRALAGVSFMLATLKLPPAEVEKVDLFINASKDEILASPRSMYAFNPTQKNESTQ